MYGASEVFDFSMCSEEVLVISCGFCRTAMFASPADMALGAALAHRDDCFTRGVFMVEILTARAKKRPQGNSQDR